MFAAYTADGIRHLNEQCAQLHQTSDAVIRASYNKTCVELGKGCIELPKATTAERATLTSPTTLFHRKDLLETRLQKDAAKPRQAIQKRV